jgi:mannose-6-phosphate isomerase-like protein (cupin superfamily)
MVEIYNNIKTAVLNNKNYRKVVYTEEGKIQLVFMCITVEDKDVPWESHKEVTQFIRVESGEGMASFKDENNETHHVYLSENSFFIIPKNTEHRIMNTSKTKDLYVTSIYSPPNHPKNRINKRKPKDE